MAGGRAFELVADPLIVFFVFPAEVLAVSTAAMGIMLAISAARLTVDSPRVCFRSVRQPEAGQRCRSQADAEFLQ